MSSNTLNNSGTPAGGEGQPEGLTRQQARAVELIALGTGYGDVADELDIGRTTLWRWRQRAAFQAYLNRLRAEASEQVRERMRSLRGQALDTLETVMTAGNPALALQAAQAVFKAATADEIGPTDPRTILKERAKRDTSQLMKDLCMAADWNEWHSTYEQLCAEEGIEP